MHDSSRSEESPAVELNLSNLLRCITTTVDNHDELPSRPSEEKHSTGLRLYIIFLALALSVLIVGLVSCGTSFMTDILIFFFHAAKALE